MEKYILLRSLMISLKPIDLSNFEECLALKVHPNQKPFIASNAYSLSEAYALTQHPRDKPIPLGIYYHDTMIGFVFVIYQPIDPNDEEDNENLYFIPRLMIDTDHQARGYGKKALLHLIEYLKTSPQGPASSIIISVDLDNTPALNLYESVGFEPIVGETDDDGDQIYKLIIA